MTVESCRIEPAGIVGRPSSAPLDWGVRLHHKNGNVPWCWQVSRRPTRYLPLDAGALSNRQRIVTDALRKFLDAPSRSPWLIFDLDEHRNAFIEFHIRS